MKRISDYKDTEAIELWADLIEPFTNIVASKEVQKILKAKERTPLLIAQTMLKASPKDVVKIMQRIDPTPIDGVNTVIRIVDVLIELMNNEDFSAFFGFAVQGVTESASSGSAMENTEAQ